MEHPSGRLIQFQLEHGSVRELNQFLHDKSAEYRMAGRAATEPDWRVEVLNPRGQHSIAVGVDLPVSIDVLGDAGYFVGGMNKQARIDVHGNAGWSVAENIMSGSVRIRGCASECVGASGQGGLVVIEGDTSSRCGISMKGCDIVVGGGVGHMSAFMAQAGNLVICGDAGPNLGDSLYEAVIYVRGTIHSLGTDARQEPMTASDLTTVKRLLDAAGIVHSPAEFKRVVSARTLYHWHVEAASAY